MRYKKRTPAPTSKGHQKKNRSSSISATPESPSHRRSTIPDDAAPLLSSNSSALLTVPTQMAMRKRSGSMPAFKLATLAAFWNLKKEHVRALRMTWARLCEPPRSNCRGIVNLVERVWEKLDSKDPSVRNIFYNAAFVETMHDRCERRRSKGSIATLRDHTHFFVSLVSQVIQSLDVDPANILEHIDTIGRNHAYLKQYGFRSGHWEKVGEYFVDIVVIQDCVRAFPEACRAWTFLVAALVDRLRAAPRRGSITPSRPSCQNSGSTQSVNSIPATTPRQGSIMASCLGSQNNLAADLDGNLSSGCPVRKNAYRGSANEVGCTNMASLKSALPDIRASSPAIA